LSVTIQISGNQAALTDANWRSANEDLRQVLNDHLASLELPAHWPPANREFEAARHAAEFVQSEIISIRRITHGPTQTSDGRQIVFKGCGLP
jgi:hypothetical protein